MWALLVQREEEGTLGGRDRMQAKGGTRVPRPSVRKAAYFGKNPWVFIQYSLWGSSALSSSRSTQRALTDPGNWGDFLKEAAQSINSRIRELQRRRRVGQKGVPSVRPLVFLTWAL